MWWASKRRFDARCRRVARFEPGQHANHDHAWPLGACRRDVHGRARASLRGYHGVDPACSQGRRSRLAKKVPPNPATDFATLKADELTKDAAKTWLNVAVKKSPDRSVLVFILGSTTGSRTPSRFAQIVHDSGVKRRQLRAPRKRDGWTHRRKAEDCGKRMHIEADSEKGSGMPRGAELRKQMGQRCLPTEGIGR